MENRKKLRKDLNKAIRKTGFSESESEAMIKSWGTLGAELDQSVNEMVEKHGYTREQALKIVRQDLQNAVKRVRSKPFSPE